MSGAAGQDFPRLADVPRAERRNVLEAIVVAEFRTALLFDDGEPMPLDANYFELGLTSLRATEIKQQLEARLGCEVGTSQLFGSPTVRQLVDHLATGPLADLFGGTAAQPVPTRTEVDRRLVDDLLQELLS